MQRVEHSWDRAVTELAKVEPLFGPLFQRFAGERIQSSGSPFQVLANSIVGQQISVKAAASISGRVTTLIGQWDPTSLLSASDANLRAAGLSLRKVEYLKGLALAFDEGQIDPARWETSENEVVQRELIALRGIGPWTAEMFLIFFLQRPDILPLGDVGLLQSAANLFEWEYPFPPQRLAERAEAWRPWRTVATWHLWRALDAEPVVY